mgnify:FL=1
MTNLEIAKVFSEMAILFEMDGVPFKPRAYEKAGQSIELLDAELAGSYREKGRGAFEGIPGA